MDIPMVLFGRVRKHFGGDTVKTWEWFQKKIPAFGNVSPIEMLKVGRVEKLKRWIDSALKDHRKL